MKSKLFITTLIVMIIFSTITVTNFKSIAVSEASIVVESKNAVQGTEIEVGIELKNTTEFSAVNFVLTYDSTVLEYKKYAVGDGVKNTDGSINGKVEINPNTKGQIKIGYISDAKQNSETKNAGKLFTITFAVNSGAGATSKIELETTTLKKADGTDVTANITSGAIKIISGIKMDNATLSLETGKTSTLKISTLPVAIDISKENITWSSSNKEILEVDENGTVTAIKAGTATISATVLGQTAQCIVTVSDPAPEISIKLNKGTLTLPEQQIRQLTAKVQGTSESVTWTSSNEKVAVIDSNGKVTALKEGTATISAKVGEKTATCTVTVSGKLGDVDGDKDITAYDAYKALEGSVNITLGVSVDEQTILRSDVNKNEKLEAEDAYKILQYSVGVINKF